ncbi:MAG: Fic family protein [Clostridiales bacterium]|nr:Fic family protein [Clostridiales bacterium]
MDKNKILQILLDDEYYTIDDLRYNKNVGILFTKDELNDFLSTKDNLINDRCEGFVKLPLKTFNSQHIFFFLGTYLTLNHKEYLSTLIKDYEENKDFLTNRNIDQIMLSRIFSEVEGTLNIENVPTTHKRIKQIFESKKLTDKNDIIIKNMQNAINYILSEKPKFNKENLFKLYSLLSENCLDEEDKLKDGLYYRDDSVSIGGYDGISHELIDEYMNGLFELVNDKEQAKKLGIFLPHICHYYILYLHPYFDYNGRTARMVSLWISIINDLSYVSPLFISEAINEFKSDYYKAIVNTRNTNNDLTYFLGYILETAIKFSLIYKNIEEIKKKLSALGEFLSNTELVYLKKILIHNSENYFNYKMFIEYVGNNMTKQGALKILHHLSEYKIIEESINKRNETIFKINPKFITYKMN